MPVDAEGNKLPPAAAASYDNSGNNPRVPPGYVEEDTGHDAHAMRTKWSGEPVTLKPEMWTTDNCVKYSQKEIMARGATAERLQRQVCLQCGYNYCRKYRVTA